MEIIKTDDFNRVFKKLPRKIQSFYKNQEERFQNNWRDSRLHVKKLRLLSLAFSFRITRNYRVLFYFQNSTTAVFFEVDNRKDIYR